MTMKVSKGLAFPAVSLPDVGHMPVAREDEKGGAGVSYLAATKTMQMLVMGIGDNSPPRSMFDGSNSNFVN